MIKKIWKYPLDVVGCQAIEVPAGGIVRHIALQDDTPTLWIEIDPAADLVTRNIYMIGTGHEFEDTGLKYMGTVVGHQGVYVWALYEERGPGDE